MEVPDFSPPSPVSPLSERASETNTPEKKISGNTKSYISCRTSTGIPRNSFITISSQSITVFADIKDLPSRNGSQCSKVEDENVRLEVEGSTKNITVLQNFKKICQAGTTTQFRRG